MKVLLHYPSPNYLDPPPNEQEVDFGGHVPRVNEEVMENGTVYRVMLVQWRRPEVGDPEVVVFLRSL